MTTSVMDRGPPKKVSRYRSLRGKSLSEARKTSEDASLDDEPDDWQGTTGVATVTVMSRTRKRSKTTTAPANPPLPSSETVPALPLSAKEPNIQWKGPGAKPHARSGSVSGSLHRSETIGSIHAKFPAPPTMASGPLPVATAITIDEAVRPGTAGAHGHGGLDLEQERRNLAERIFREEAARRRKEEDEAARWADEVARLEAETDRILAEQKKRDLARLQNQLAAQHPSAGLMVGKPKSPVLEKFAFFNRGRRSNGTTLSPTSSTFSAVTSTSAFSPTSSTFSSVDFTRQNSLEPMPMPPLPRTCTEQNLIASMDQGDRQVTVRCRHITMSLPVTAGCTTLDILFGVSEALTSPINTSASLVIETFASHGLERRLRRYERVREVLNSWDQDDQNSLVVLPADTFESDMDLDIASVPRTEDPPHGFTLQLYHSQRPGKWTKRFITLLDNGQVYGTKKPDAAAQAAAEKAGTIKDKDAQRLCHMSDFDIYTPTEAQMRKVLKPPKKYCYAVRSQQKSTLFGDDKDRETNYVHYFSTEDPAAAHTFHSLIHGWRSWYLVNRQIEVQRKVQQKMHEERPPQIMSVRHKPKKSISHVKVNGHRVRVSIDESPYALGVFSPLLDMDRFAKPLDEFGADWLPDSGRYSIRPPVPGQPPKPPSPPSDPSFAPNGLLGTDYDSRRKATISPGQTPAPLSATVDGPFTDAPTLLNGGIPSDPSEKPEPAPWLPSASAHTARTRSQSVTRPSTSSGVPTDRRRAAAGAHPGPPPPMPPPLVSFGPSREHVPQWDRRAQNIKGPGAHLVDLISTGAPPRQFLEVPPRNIVRRDTKGSTAPPRPATSDGRQRSRSVSNNSGAGIRGRGGEEPPVPPLPLAQRPSTRDGGEDPGFGGRDRALAERGWNPRSRELITRGRSGTVRR